MNRLTSASAVLAIATSLFVTVPAKAKVYYPVINIPSDPKVHEKMKLLKEKK